MDKTITYVRKDRYGHVERVDVPRASVAWADSADGYLTESVTALFVEALKRAGIPVDRLVAEAKERPYHELDLEAGPLAHIAGRRDGRPGLR